MKPVCFGITNIVGPSCMVNGLININGEPFWFTAVLETKRGKSTTLILDLKTNKVTSKNKQIKIKEFKLYK